jgi:hypothetical protein
VPRPPDRPEGEARWRKKLEPTPVVPSGNLDAALGYARRGYAVLPVRGKGKGPLTAPGVHDSSTDEWVLFGWCRRARDDSSVAWSDFQNRANSRGPDTNELGS